MVSSFFLSYVLFLKENSIHKDKRRVQVKLECSHKVVARLRGKADFTLNNKEETPFTKVNCCKQIHTLPARLL
jgi:hypothetical protein